MPRKLIAAALVAAFAVAPASAQTILKLSSPAPPPSFLHAGVFEPWAKAVEEASGGTVKVQMFYGGQLGNFGVNYDRVVDGVADVGFILTGLAGGKFKQQDVASLAFETKDSNETAVALWRMFEKGVTAAEFNQVKLLGTWSFPNAALHSSRPIANLADMKGKKFSVANPITGSIMVALGASPVTLRPDEAYQAISRGTIDGAVMPFTGMATFKLHEVAKAHLDAALGGDAAAMIMNKAKYDALPAQAKAAIDKASGLDFTRKLGAATQAEWERGRSLVKDVVKTLDPNEEKAWKAALEPVAQKWAEGVPNGAAVLKAFREEVAALRK
jgi:TRAP-type C4-dicarboxylate transport system substrate-binding protein